MALLSEHYLCGAVREELAHLLEGFFTIVPKHLLQASRIDDKDLGPRPAKMLTCSGPLPLPLSLPHPLPHAGA